MVTPQISELTTGVRRLLYDQKRLTATGLWKAIMPAERLAAACAFLESEDEERESLVEAVADLTKTRLETVRRWSDNKIAVAMKSPMALTPTVALSLLVCLHLPNRQKMIKRFMKLVGESPEDGYELEFSEGFRASNTVVRKAGDTLVSEYGQHPTIVYALLMILRRVPIAGELRSWLDATGVKMMPTVPATAGNPAVPAEADLNGNGRADNGVASSGPVLPPTDPPTQNFPAPNTDGGKPNLHTENHRDALPNSISTRSLTTLDRLLNNATIDSSQGILGSLTEKEMTEAVNEFVRLNGRRPPSFFHAGFCASIFDRPLLSGLRGQDRDRARWYWAGAVQGWAYAEAWPVIVGQYDRRPVVRDLGDGSDLASGQAVEYLVRALREEGRTKELGRFLKVPAVVAGTSKLFQALMEAGTELLRNHDAAEARCIFEILVQAATEMEKRGVSPGKLLVAESKRRYARCLTLLEEHDRARSILEGLLNEKDVDMLAKVHADLGILAGGFKWMADIRLPDDRDDLSLVLEKIGKGAKHFERSIACDAPCAGHGHYCKGVLELGRAVERNAVEEEYREIAAHLKLARAQFLSNTGHYAQALVRQGCLFSGIANALSLAVEEFTPSTRIIAGALDDGATFPSYLITATMDALDLGDVDDLCVVSGAILRTGGESALDALAEGPAVGKCKMLAGKLRERAQKPKRAKEGAAFDLRAAVRGYMRHGEYDTVAQLLDELEVLATEGVGIGKFAELLKEPEQYEPAWSVEDAGIALARCYEVQGRYPEATQILQEKFHQFASQETDAALHDATGVLERVKSYGIDASYYEDMETRHAALASAREESLGPGIAEPAKVLMVGGNETQARQDVKILSLLNKSHPHITVTFVRTGWGSNWQKPLEEVRRLLPIHDAVAIMRFMRTELGKHIRRECGTKPWRSCWSAGPKSQVETIVRAASAAKPMHLTGE